MLFLWEKWKDIPGYKGFYQASDQCRIRSLNRTITDRIGRTKRLEGKILSAPCVVMGNGGYKCRTVGLSRKGRQWVKLVHRLVLKTFVGPCPDNHECCHNNGNSLDNRLSNLRWDTRKANVKDACMHGTRVMQGVRRSDGVEFKSLTDAGRSVGLHNQSISAVANGRTESAGGFGWEFT